MSDELPNFDLPAEVLQLLSQIPRGQVTTYGDLARALGDDKTRSARWLGEYLHHHSHHRDCMCHRVIRASGEIGLHVSGDPHVKMKLLAREGISVSASGKVDLSHLFTQFQSRRPLEQLRSFQKSLRQDLRQTPLTQFPETFGAVDVAYREDGTACGAYLLLDAKTLQVRQELTVKMPVSFPYIPGYLTFRELPVMLELCERARTAGLLGDVIFCDGNGQLHPWRAGIATCLGVLLDHPTLGVGKSLLCGSVRAEDADPAVQSVYDGEEMLARVIRLSANAKPVYISVGHRITLDQASRMAQKSFAAHRVPEPIFLVDRLTKLLKTRPD